jgi:hypothetical protein
VESNFDVSVKLLTVLTTYFPYSYATTVWAATATYNISRRKILKMVRMVLIYPQEKKKKEKLLYTSKMSQYMYMSNLTLFSAKKTGNLSLFPENLSLCL